MVQQNYIGANGIKIQSLPEIINDLSEKFKYIYGQDINIEQNSPDGQFINIIAQEKKDLLDFVVSIYNNLDVDTAIGLPQQILYKLNGLKIKAYTYSYCYVNVTINKPINLKGLDNEVESENGVGFTVSDSAGNNWILVESQNLTEVGTYLLNFRAEQLGSVQATANTINIMSTILAGVVSVNNPANNYITGQIGESDSEFRKRRNKMMAVPSQGFDESIKSQLLNLTNVTQAKVYDNRTNEEVNEIPPHTIWVIVEGGESDEIGRVIYNNLPPGIPMKGEQEINVIKSDGTIAVVNYDLPNAINIYIKANIKNNGTIPLDEQYIKQQLAINKFEIGQMIESSNITTLIKNIIGEQGNPYNVEISLNGSNYFPSLTPTGLSDYFVITTDKIDFVVS